VMVLVNIAVGEQSIDRLKNKKKRRSIDFMRGAELSIIPAHRLVPLASSY
jgi:hypothetical protein